MNERSSLPRRAESSSALCRLRSPSSVARTTLTGLVEPSDLDRMSLTPAASTTARTEPPAMTPVPCEAGLRSTVEAPYCWVTACGMVVPTRGTRMRCFLASSTPLRMASGTSPALPRPTPTWPLPSPTTTTALKLNRRPPLTTFATRLIWTTRSSRVSLLGSMRAMGLLLEVQAGSARAIGERLDPPVVPEPRAVEHDLGDAGRPGTLGEEGTHLLGALHLGAATTAQRCLERGCAGEGAAHGVVDDLGIDLRVAAE